MRTDDYTPDGICEALGVGTFGGYGREHGPLKELRVLLCPSFAPEVFLNLWENGGGVKAVVVVGRTQIWTLPSIGRVTADRSSHGLADVTFERIERDFRSALAEPSRSVVIMDGMPVHIRLNTVMGSLEVHDNPGSSMLAEFLAGLIERLYRATDNQRCRNGLAMVGSYLGLKLFVVPEKDLEEVSTIMALGAPDERAEVLEALAVVAVRNEADEDEAKPESGLIL